MIPTTIFSDLHQAALAKLQTLVPSATWAYVNSLDAQKIDSQTVLLTPGLTPFDLSVESRAADKAEIRLAVTILDKMKPGANVDSNVSLLVQIAQLFERQAMANCVCTRASIPVLCDPDLAASNLYQGVVELLFVCVR